MVNGEVAFPEGALGLHTFWDIKGVKWELLDDFDLIEKTMLEAAKSCGATILRHQSHRFEPHGVTVLVMLAESHLSFHSWPEKGAAAVDLFSCSPKMDGEEVSRLIEKVFSPETLGKRVMVRGRT